MKALLITLWLISTVLFTACWTTALTESQQAEKYWLTMEEYQEQKEAAGRMNMNIDDHLKALSEDGWDMEWMEWMDMWN